LTPGDLSDQLNWKHRLLPRRLSLKDDSSAGMKISLDAHLGSQPTPLSITSFALLFFTRVS
jgi:hypothetical protein